MLMDPQAGSGYLAAVIVTYNSGEALPGLLDSLGAGLSGIRRTEVVVADNASTDDSVEIASRHPIGARVIKTGRNGGYAAGINAALSVVPEEADVLILNPDIRLRPGAARPLVERLRKFGAGVAVPRLLHEDGTLVHSLRREPSIVTAWADALLGTSLGSRIDVGECICDTRRYSTGARVDWGSGAALCVSARARAKVSAWDESYFLYSEEVDFQRRVRDAGMGIAFVPESEMVHIGGDYRRNARLYAILTANRIRYYRRHHGVVPTFMFRMAVVAGEVLRSLGGSPVHRAGLLATLRPWSPAHPAAPIGAPRLTDA